MRRLNSVSEAWRNYLYANGDSHLNDVDNFFTRMELITGSQEQILETMLLNEPDMQLVRECKEEIAFQREELKEMVTDFCNYYENCVSSKEQAVLPEEILDELCISGINGCLYEVAKDWEKLGKRAYLIWDKLNDSYSGGVSYIRDDLCKAVFEIICQ